VKREDITGKVVKVLWPLNTPPLYDTVSEHAVSQDSSGR
jgi:hypothetical protein